MAGGAGRGSSSGASYRALGAGREEKAAVLLAAGQQPRRATNV